MKRGKQKPKTSVLSRIWKRIVRNTSGQECKIGIPDKQAKRRGR